MRLKLVKDSLESRLSSSFSSLAVRKSGVRAWKIRSRETVAPCHTIC